MKRKEGGKDWHLTPILSGGRTVFYTLSLTLKCSQLWEKVLKILVPKMSSLNYLLPPN